MRAILAVVMLVSMGAPVSAAAPLEEQRAASGQDAAVTLAERLVGRMTLDEKLPQLLNAAPAITRLGVPRYSWWTESLHGAIGPVATTIFPAPIGLAATFDPELVHDVAGAIGTEVRGLHSLARRTGGSATIGGGLDSWSPNINIFRDPRWGRGQETYGEDPYLTARMAVAFVTGLQGPDPARPLVTATPKHFAVHSGPEGTRHVADVEVSAHDLEDTYLPAFRAAITEAKAGSIMCAYNSVDGQPACASQLLLEIKLRRAWGFEGYVVSDCDALKDISEGHHFAPDAPAAVAVAIKRGVDVECNIGTLTGDGSLPSRYRAALDRGLITVADVDRALIRLFAARYRTGDLPGLAGTAAAVAPDRIGGAAQAELALRSARESIVLLKNDRLLPLRPGLRVAVVGPLADATRVLRGSYSSSVPNGAVSVAAGLRRAYPAANVAVVPFGPSPTDGSSVPTSALLTPDGKPGLLASYYNMTGFVPGQGGRRAPAFADHALVTRIEPDVAARASQLPSATDTIRAVWTGFLVPPESGSYRIGLAGINGALEFEGREIVSMPFGFGQLPSVRQVILEKDRRYPIKVVSNEQGGADLNLLWQRVSQDPAGDLARAAARADVIVAVVGYTADMEGEESKADLPGFARGDRTTLDLPAEQRRLLEEAKATGKPLIVVAMSGGGTNLGWAKANAAAILQAWFPGEAGGRAIAEVLTGAYNPSGRLPVTFYAGVDQLPPFADYSMKNRTYRYFAGKPLFPFGYGLSYSRFTFAPLAISQPDPAAPALRVSTTVRNAGARAGGEVAQLYLAFPDVPGVPGIALRGMRRVALAPGESRRVTFDLSARDLSAVTADGKRRVLKGAYRVSVGAGQPAFAEARRGTFAIRRDVDLPE